MSLDLLFRCIRELESDVESDGQSEQGGGCESDGQSDGYESDATSVLSMLDSTDDEDDNFGLDDIFQCVECI